MENNSFKKLFLRNFGLFSLLILGCKAFVTDSSSDEEYENFKILITSSGGLQFSKEESPEGRKIIYDCELGVKNVGEIWVFDNIHPYDMKSLIIKNCFEVTLQETSCYDNTIKFFKLKELKISNVTSLRLSSGSCYQGSSVIESEEIKVSISNVGHLEVGTFFRNIRVPRLSLKLQNVAIDTLGKLFDEDQRNVLNLHFKNVKINETEIQAINSRENSNLILTVENSHFEYVHRKAFLLKGTVIIINNTFSFLDEAAFSVNTSSSFTFSGNRVKRMLNPFYISSSEVNIINNIFDSIVQPWLPKITGSETSYNILNITGNIINHWSHNMFYMEPQNFPDIIIFEGNYLNCSCKNAITLSYKIQDYITEVFLNKQQKNFCHNLGNCPLHKALWKGSGICINTFRCPEDDRNEDDENARMWPSHVKSILSVLKNIDIKLDQIVSKHNSSLVDKPN